MEKLFIIGDTHFGLDAEKPMDVFGSRWEDHASKISESWKNRISENDVTIVNGDLSWGISLNETRRDLALLNSFPGRKILLKGNHDLWWETMTKVSGFFRDEKFDSLLPLYNSACYLPRADVLICGTRGWRVPDNAEYQPSDAKVLRREMMRFELSVNYGRTLAERFRALRESPACGSPACADGKGTASGKAALYGAAGSGYIIDACDDAASKRDGPEIIAVFHYPPFDYGTKRDTEWAELLGRYNVKRCFFGHVHNVGPCKRNGEGEPLPVLQRNGIGYYLTAADYLGFEPMEIRL